MPLSRKCITVAGQARLKRHRITGKLGKNRRGISLCKWENILRTETRCGCIQRRASLFTHYSYMGFNPQKLTDRFTNYFHNNQTIARINLRYCMEIPEIMPVMAPIAGDSPQAISRGDIRRRNPSPSGITELLLLQEHWLHSLTLPKNQWLLLKIITEITVIFYGELTDSGMLST